VLAKNTRPFAGYANGRDFFASRLRSRGDLHLTRGKVKREGHNPFDRQKAFVCHLT